jgi:transcriptional regulator of acetoin/glycerol metabolism
MPVERSSAAAAAADSAGASERDRLESVLRDCKWNKNAAAETLGISYKTLLNKIHAHGLD